MNVATQTPVKENEVQDKQLPAWKKPVIMRIELARTLFRSGSAIDCEAGSVPVPCGT